MSTFTLTILGARGSMAVSGQERAQFGGATSCYMVQAGEQTVFLDGGSGLIDAPSEFASTPAILLSHLHLDHILGLGMYARLSKKGRRTDLYVPAEEGEDASSALDRVYSPPYWPLRLGEYAGDVRIFPFSSSMRIGDVLVETMPGAHPGGCLAIKLTFEGKSLVYATDQEPDGETLGRLADLAKDADLLMFDGQFTDAEAEMKKGFGHSAPSEAIALMERCGAKLLLLIHHDPLRTDAQILAAEQAIGLENVRFARAGETIRI